jgi:hypothetical protein
MSTCQRCGATFHCAMADAGPDGQADTQPCWCTALPPAVPVPAQDATAPVAVGCWCPACLRAHIASLQAADGP